MRSLENKPNVQAPDDDYPYGRIKDNPGDGTGTPVNEFVYGDFHQFFAKLFAESGLVANELPDNDYTGFQLYEALLQKLNSSDAALGIKTKIFQIGDWNMDTNISTTVDLDPIMGKNVVKISVIINRDPELITGDILISDLMSAGGGYYTLSKELSTVISLFRTASGIFDNINYADTAFNRGIIVVEYIDGVV